ncbi:MAG: hypothetical protein AAFX99_29440, partial [Myxococcota bacterium]
MYRHITFRKDVRIVDIWLDGGFIGHAQSFRRDVSLDACDEEIRMAAHTKQENTSAFLETVQLKQDGACAQTH